MRWEESRECDILEAKQRKCFEEGIIITYGAFTLLRNFCIFFINSSAPQSCKYRSPSHRSENQSSEWGNVFTDIVLIPLTCQLG